MRAILAVAAILVAGALVHRARAHTGMPPPINIWGAFDSGTAQCQRVIGNSIQRCFERVFAARRRCMDAQLAGTPCDPTMLQQHIADAETAAQGELAAGCTLSQVQILHFLSLEEADADLVLACGNQADAAMSLIYGPAVNTGTSAATPTMQACLGDTANLSAKLLHFATVVKRRTLDRIAARNFTPTQKTALLARAEARIASAQQKIQSLIQQACPSFGDMYQRDMSSFMTLLDPRSDCLVGLGYVQNSLTCPAPVCGNGVKEAGEQCDDGNTIDNDLCHNNCTTNDCTTFSSTFDLIQSAVFDSQQHQCSNDLCHGNAKSGGLSLKAGESYSNLVGVPSQIDPSLHRVEAGDEQRSMLYLKLAALTLGRTGVPGSPMPNGGLPALTPNELEAVRLWIHADAPETGVVLGVSDLLNACALPADPIQIQAPPPPAPGTGVQIHMPKWPLPPHSENEVCFATYYDLTDQVPPQFRGSNGTTFRFHKQDIIQDPQSHHLIVNLYTGSAGISDPSWGAFTCKGGALDGQPCDPTDMSACGSDGACGSEPTRSVACIGFGPPDAQTNGFSGFTGTQQTSYEQTFADGVYEEVPIKGIIIWNSHAFNLTNYGAKQEAWLNFTFAQPQDQQYPVHGIFDLSHIFDMSVPPFQTEEICACHELEQNAQLFQLSSHNHRHGKRFTIYVPNGTADLSTCNDPGQQSSWNLIFTSTVYNDPIQLTFSPALSFTGADPATRTLKYCSLYDNGATDPTEVKTKSGSPPTPNGFPFGGPCQTPTGCTQGMVGQPCSGINQTKRNQSCDTSPGAGDGFCDACTLKGGVTTEDEMFILLGSYFVR